MLSLEIEDKLKDNPYFIGVYARDQLPCIESYPCCLIANTDTHDQQGTHWVAIYIDEYGYGEYFDAYGNKPFFHEFYDFFAKHTIDFRCNPIALQCDTCITCGHYCLVYILLRSCCFNLHQFLCLFTVKNRLLVNRKSNDIIVKNYLNIS